MFLSDVSIKRPVFATMMMLALVVLGVVSYKRLAIDEYPDITYPTIIAQTTFPGASPQVMEREVSRPIERALNTVQGVREVTSTSYEGSSLVRLQFNLEADIMAAQQDVQAKVSRIRRQLPEDVEDPVVIRFDPNDRPIIQVAMQSSERTLRELTDMADEIVSTRLEAVSGVGGVNRVGGAQRQIKVQLDPAAMRAYNIGPPQVISALQRENMEVPAGRVRGGNLETAVRVLGRVADPKAFADIAVTVRNGVPVKIGDVGRVVDATADQRSAAFAMGVPAVSVEVLKISGANTVQVADGVKAAIAELQRQVPQDIKFTVIRDDSQRIREALADVELTIVLGALLTIAIIYLFLNSWRSTVITGLTLPVSIISAFFGMWLFGFTINTMTLLALSLAIGLLIDDAIVVRENIVRHLEMGKDHELASKEGTDEIGLAVFSTTLAVVAVFVPVAFMSGMIGRIFFQFGITMAFAVLVSLFVSFTLDPMLSSVWADPEIEHGGTAGMRDAGRGMDDQAVVASGEDRPASRVPHPASPPRKRGPIRRFAFWFNDRFEQLADGYPRLLDRALNHRGLVMLIALASIVASFVILPRLGFTWMPDYDAGEFSVNFRAPPGSRIEYTIDKGQALANYLRELPETEFTYMTVGGGFRGTPSSGEVFVRLKHERDRSMFEIQQELRGQLRQIPGIRATISGTRSIFGGFRQPIQVLVQGPEPTRLKLAADQVLQAIQRVPGVAEPNSAQEDEIPQLDVRVDRAQAWSVGLGINAIASTLQPLFTGQRATEWEDQLGYSHDVVVVYPDSMRTSAEDVQNIAVPSTNVDPRTGQPSMVPLSQVAEVRAGTGPQSIERRSLERQITLSTGVLPGYNMGDVADAVRAEIDRVGLPAGYRTVFAGDVQNLDETKGYVLEALLLAVVFIYLILASIFGSFLQPLAIMLSLPLSFLGVALALLVTKGNMNVMTMVGVITLMGLVTKNGILLIDFVNQRREEGADRRRAILDSGRIRLRPIIMTTIAMIFGMLPLALAIGEGAEQRSPMAHAVIGGLITSTLLTLFVVPVVYTLLDDFTEWVRARRHAPESTRGWPLRDEPQPEPSGD
ncbi:MAG TPA: efflux RND transporter permease subunit [Gemmatimonadaceae bacterium]|nr:efflux RND transporter permease subunit [Gemmatimonadaceae bacterium]